MKLTFFLSYVYHLAVLFLLLIFIFQLYFYSLFFQSSFFLFSLPVIISNRLQVPIAFAGTDHYYPLLLLLMCGFSLISLSSFWVLFVLLYPCPTTDGLRHNKRNSNSNSNSNANSTREEFLPGSEEWGWIIFATPATFKSKNFELLEMFYVVSTCLETSTNKRFLSIEVWLVYPRFLILIMWIVTDKKQLIRDIITSWGWCRGTWTGVLGLYLSNRLSP